VCTWERTEAGFRCVWCDREARHDELDAIERRFARRAAVEVAVPPCECPAPIEAPVPAVDPMAPGQRVMRVGDLVVERLAHGKTRDWIVTAVGADGPTMHNDGFHETVTWGHITLDSADLWRLSSEHDPVPTAPSRSDGRPADEGAVNGVRIGDRLILDGVSVEVLGVDRDGFVWRTTDDSDRMEGDVEWTAVRRVSDGVWAPRTINAPDPIEEPAVEAPPPAAKAKRTRKPRAPKAAPSTEPAAPVPHRLQAVTEADELAHHGAHSLIGLRGEAWLTLATRSKDETLPEWQVRCTTASKAVRVRVYDRGAHCTWDSLDGAREGHIQGNP
jgi:hypothetical protein